MNLKKNLLLMLLMALIPALNGCAKPEALQYQDVQHFRVHSVNFQEVVFAMDLRFFNPNRYGLELRNGDIDAFVNDHYLGKALLSEQVRVPPRDTFLLPVTFKSALTDLLGNAWAMVSNNSMEIRVRMNGSIRAGKSGVFLPIPIRYEGKQQIQL